MRTTGLQKLLGIVQEMAVKICQTILRQRTLVSSMEKVEMLLDFISPLVKDTEGLEDDDEVSPCTMKSCSTLAHSLQVPWVPCCCKAMQDLLKPHSIYHSFS